MDQLFFKFFFHLIALNCNLFGADMEKFTIQF